LLPHFVLIATANQLRKPAKTQRSTSKKKKYCSPASSGGKKQVFEQSNSLRHEIYLTYRIRSIPSKLKELVLSRLRETSKGRFGQAERRKQTALAGSTSL
jgi:hypothetical protein